MCRAVTQGGRDRTATPATPVTARPNLTG